MFATFESENLKIKIILSQFLPFQPGLHSHQWGTTSGWSAFVIFPFIHWMHIQFSQWNPQIISVNPGVQ